MLTLTDQDFQRLYVYIKQNYGIDLSKKKQLIVSRLSHTLAAQGFRDFKGYVDEILSGRDTDMVTAMLNKLTTNYTYFLREEAHFKYFQEIILPDLEKKHAADKSLSIWSAGCSSGQEPYTISMFLQNLPSGIPEFLPRIYPTRFWMKPSVPATRRKVWSRFLPHGRQNIL